MDRSLWSVDASVFECRMSHDIPFYGDALFKRKAGESASFQLSPMQSRFQTGKASLVSRAPLWKPGGDEVNLGWVNVNRGKMPVKMSQQRSERLLAELHAGRELVLTRAPWYGAENSSKVVLSPVNFQGAYREYLACLGQLLPVNYDQIRRSSIYFPSGNDILPVSEIRKLDHIGIYVDADKTVKRFYVDGHTDSVGPRGDNLELSQRRAEMVVGLLVERGIPREQITTRWHGERYPVASNRTLKGRALNRRVTVRLEKEGPKVPSLASSGNGPLEGQKL
ncbi:OmpA family protein [Pseudomaricurvus alkylphenolicus]|uniref:flagellar protein MotY n=1 Tax=Pseudomaricurvus alkylphenolicus TaxID=1306991 RepID=UPI00141F6C4F|nr:OmpA family protein [Pseudomaricurvus alkylphenolicus]NIB41943.1 OmpA family protein [Pseudomaricurvus alkylphenolicus]